MVIAMNKKTGRLRKLFFTVGALAVLLFVILPLALNGYGGSSGNIAIIPIEGVITGNGASVLGRESVSSQDIVGFIEEAEQNSRIDALLLEINSPGGSAVASDEVASAVKKVQKPVVAVIREVGASGGYWIASAADYVVANRMSITGSIGVLSSYLEFSGLMEEYGVSYQRLVAGEKKDIGTPFRQLKPEERSLLEQKLQTIHGFFIEEIAANRNLDLEAAEELATGEFYLGIEAWELGLVDQLGDREMAEEYLRSIHGIETFDYVEYRRTPGLLDIFASAANGFSFSLGRGMASLLLEREYPMLWT